VRLLMIWSPLEVTRSTRGSDSCRPGMNWAECHFLVRHARLVCRDTGIADQDSIAAAPSLSMACGARASWVRGLLGLGLSG
jgi:hypothetical protein